MENPLTPAPRFPAPPQRSAGVLPLHGGRTHAPSSVLVRARLGEEADAARARAAVAFLGELSDAARAASAEPRWWTEGVEVGVEEVAGRALLSLPEAEAALLDLESAGVLLPAERGVRVDADVLCECPVLERFDLEGARLRIRERGELVAPATALLRELVRLADGAGVVHTTFPRLLESVLYGRTRLTQALGVLEEVRVAARTDLPNRMLRIQLRDGASAPAPSPAAPRGAGAAKTPPRPARAPGGRMPLPTGAPLQIGGEELRLLPGMVPELELGEDGRYYLWLGPVRVGPYDP